MEISAEAMQEFTVEPLTTVPLSPAARAKQQAASQAPPEDAEGETPHSIL